jgi:hypothetical protein
MVGDVSVRVMRADEWAEARAVCIDAFQDPGMSLRGALVYADAFWRADGVGLRE